MNRRGDKLVWDKVLKEEHRSNCCQAEQRHCSGHEQHDIDNGPLDRLRGDDARGLLECFLAHAAGVSLGAKLEDADNLRGRLKLP